MNKFYSSDPTRAATPEIDGHTSALRKEAEELAVALASERAARIQAESTLAAERRRLRNEMVDAVSYALASWSAPTASEDGSELLESASLQKLGIAASFLTALNGKGKTRLARGVAKGARLAIRLLRELRMRADIQFLRSSGKLDESWYLREYPDIENGDLDAIAHYVRFGAAEGRRPTPNFERRTPRASRPWDAFQNPFVAQLKQQERSSAISRLVPRALARRALPRPGRFRDQVTRTANDGWYGNRRLTSAELCPGVMVETSSEAIYAAQTNKILSTFLEAPGEASRRALPLRIGLAASIEGILASRTASEETASSSNRPTYSIVTPYFAHDEFFRRCGRSVERLIARDWMATGQPRIEWIIVNDDPSRSNSQIAAMIPEPIRKLTRILGDGRNRGIAVRLNEGILAARNEWILLLDCDDMLVSSACSVLDHYIREFPKCRYISASIVDIDKNDHELRRRRRRVSSTKLFEFGQITGHLVAVRNDLFRDIGPYDPAFTGCQDYEFALRAAMTEPLLQIPEHLYAYRWHEQSQSVGRAERQERIANAVRHSVVTRAVQMRWPDSTERDRPPLPEVPRGMCIVRTQGKRLELLRESLESISTQTIPLVACVVVHGDHEVFKVVERYLIDHSLGVVLLHAPDLKRKRGYPLNVALEYLENHASDFDYFCFLDDDDILYPTFAERLSRTLSLSASDVAFCQSNARDRKGCLESVYPPLPPTCLVADNFIPINSYLVRLSTFPVGAIRFREDMDYLEDWDFLLSLLEAGCRFQNLGETLSEFRLIGDGNSPIRRDLKHFEACKRRLTARGFLVARELGPSALFRDLLDFKARDRRPLSDLEIASVYDAMRAFGLTIQRPK